MEFRTSNQQQKDILEMNKRKEERIREENKVVFSLNSSVKNGEEAKKHVALTADFSPGGVRIMTPVPMSVGDNVYLEVVLSHIRKVVQMEGSVRWVKRLYRDEIFEAGIEFTKIAAEDCLLILRHTYQR